MKKDILWLIPARSGSKSVPNKNIRPLGGLPLLAYRIKSALAIADAEDIWISTDSQEYADIAAAHGATVPFLRPAELASDTASSLDVVMHAIQEAEKRGKHYQAIGLLEPTAPFIYAEQLKDAAEQLMAEPEAENIVAVKEIKGGTLFTQVEDKYLAKIAENVKKYGHLRRQDTKREVTPSGGFYIIKVDPFKKNKAIYTERTLGYLVPDLNAVEIDEPIDWAMVQFLIEKDLINLQKIFNL